MNSLWRNHLVELDIDLLELKGFSRSIAELEWLLVVLMLLYYVIIGVTPDHRLAVLSAIAIYSTFVLLFRYSNLFKTESRGRFAIEIQSMVVINYRNGVVYRTDREPVTESLSPGHHCERNHAWQARDDA